MNDAVKAAPTIAIVDDDVSVGRSLLRVVQSAGYKAEAFTSARQFLDWLPRHQAACLVLDVHMNEMNGFDLQGRLAVPIIFITAHDDAPTLERIEKSGAAGLVRKPFDAPTVLDADPPGSPDEPRGNRRRGSDMTRGVLGAGGGALYGVNENRTTNATARPTGAD